MHAFKCAPWGERAMGARVWAETDLAIDSANVAVHIQSRHVLAALEFDLERDLVGADPCPAVSSRGDGQTPMCSLRRRTAEEILHKDKQSNA